MLHGLCLPQKNLNVSGHSAVWFVHVVWLS